MSTREVHHQGKALSRSTATWAPWAALVLLLALVAVALSASRESAGPRVTLGQSTGNFPGQTAADWVTYGDHVVVVSPVAEEVLEPASTELEQGEGLILRRLEMRVDNVVWSDKNAQHAVPDSFMWTAPGWAFKGGDLSNRIEMASEGTPRFEVGHSYIMAIFWVRGSCGSSREEPSGQWFGLSGDSEIPYDDGIIGKGELEGQEQTLEEARANASRPDDPNYRLQDQMIGRDEEELSRALADATAEPSKQSPADC